MGLKFHDDPEVLHYGKKGTGMLLVPGMVFTIEPMINTGTWKVFIDSSDGWTVITEDELPSVTFDWDNIIDVYDDNATKEQQTAVATLKRYCGQIVQMGYSPKLSSAQYIDLDMMMRNFGYGQGATMVNASSYSVQGWYDLLYNELREGRPIFFGASSTGGGHAFVIDGYTVNDGEPYFHINWDDQIGRASCRERV